MLKTSTNLFSDKVNNVREKRKLSREGGIDLNDVHSEETDEDVVGYLGVVKYDINVNDKDVASNNGDVNGSVLEKTLLNSKPDETSSVFLDNDSSVAELNRDKINIKKLHSDSEIALKYRIENRTATEQAERKNAREYVEQLVQLIERLLQSSTPDELVQRFASDFCSGNSQYC